MTRLIPILLVVITFVTFPMRGGELDRFGGAKALQREATGFFRVEEIGERWYFVTPEGHPYIALGGNHVGRYLANEARAGGMLERFEGDPDKAAEALLLSLRELGLNAGDAYQPEPRFAERLPWVKSFHYLPEPKKGWPDVFDADEMQEMHEHVRKQCATIADEPWVIGLAGPDLPKWDRSFVQRYRLNPVGSPGLEGYVDFLKQRHPAGINSLNSAYGTRFPSWEALEKKPRLDLQIETDAARADDEAFLGMIAERHFAAVRAACREGAPNHLYLGERTQLRTIPDSVLAAMGQHIDGFCTQSLIRLPQDPPEWQVFQREHYDREFALVGKPMIIIDWAAPFSLGDREEKTEYGTLKPESEAAADAAQFVRDAFEPPYLVGLFICQVLGSHHNDRFFPRARRTYLRDDGTPFPERARRLGEANREVLDRLYQFP